jgi:hypothetical protein
MRDNAVEGSKKYPWQEKMPIAYWRGAGSGRNFYRDVPTWDNIGKYYPRMELIRQSVEHPNKIDAVITYLNGDDTQAKMK